MRVMHHRTSLVCIPSHSDPAVDSMFDNILTDLDANSTMEAAGWSYSSNALQSTRSQMAVGGDFPSILDVSDNFVTNTANVCACVCACVCVCVYGCVVCVRGWGCAGVLCVLSVCARDWVHLGHACAMSADTLVLLPSVRAPPHTWHQVKNVTGQQCSVTPTEGMPLSYRLRRLPLASYQCPLWLALCRRRVPGP
jgi:hypothetical protein